MQALPVALSSLATLSLGLTLPAQDISISDNNALFTKDFENSRTTLYPTGSVVDFLRADPNGDPAGALFKSSWVYRQASDTREYFFNDSGGQTTYNNTGNAGFAFWNDVDGLGLFSALASYRVASTGATSGVAIAEMKITNTSASPITLTVFHFCDLDLCGAAFNMNTSTSGADGRQLHTTTCGETGEHFVAGADKWESQTSGNLYNRFGDAAIDDLVNNTGSVGPGDIRAAFQWSDRTILPGRSETFVVQMSHNDAGCGASGAFYGPDAPISSGTVALQLTNPPILGQAAVWGGTNYVPNAPMLHVIGLQQTNVVFPGLGVTLLNDALAVVNLPTVTGTTFSVGLPIPATPALCGGLVFTQLFYVDGGAPNGLGGHSQGTKLQLGNY